MEPTPLVAQIRAWQQGIASEIAFWDQWLSTKGGAWPEEFAQRMDPERELLPWVLGPFADRDVCILDVGAGPLTALGPRYGQRRASITACDPLAPYYSELARRHDVVRPIETEQAFAEDLSSFYPPETFDIVFCMNALDHSFDPLRGIEEMLRVAKPRGRVVLAHSANEAVNENYSGLHQWNFDAENADFIIWSRDRRFNVSALFSRWAAIDVAKHNGSWVNVVFEKSGSPLEPADGRASQRVRELLAAMLAASVQAAAAPATSAS